MVYFGEVGLSGEVRQVAQAEARLKEAAKLGFDAAALPRRVAHGNRKLSAPDGLAIGGNRPHRRSGRPLCPRIGQKERMIRLATGAGGTITPLHFQWRWHDVG